MNLATRAAPSYDDFLRGKLQLEDSGGFEPLWLPNFLFDFQRFLVEWALRKGRAALYADTGLGKALDVDTPVLTPTGFRPISDLTPGDYVVGAKDPADEGHVHPLQLDVIERAIILWSNPGETVFTPFMGVGSEVYGALANGRRGIGVELKPSYYRQAVLNVKAASDIGARLEADEKIATAQLSLMDMDA